MVVKIIFGSVETPDRCKALLESGESSKEVYW